MVIMILILKLKLKLMLILILILTLTLTLMLIFTLIFILILTLILILILILVCDGDDGGPSGEPRICCSCTKPRSCFSSPCLREGTGHRPPTPVANAMRRRRLARASSGQRRRLRWSALSSARPGIMSAPGCGSPARVMGLTLVVSISRCRASLMGSSNLMSAKSTLRATHPPASWQTRATAASRAGPRADKCPSSGTGSTAFISTNVTYLLHRKRNEGQNLLVRRKPFGRKHKEFKICRTFIAHCAKYKTPLHQHPMFTCSNFHNPIVKAFPDGVFLQPCFPMVN